MREQSETIILVNRIKVPYMYVYYLHGEQQIILHKIAGRSTHLLFAYDMTRFPLTRINYVLLLPACACGEQNDVTLNCKMYNAYLVIRTSKLYHFYESLNQPVRQ